MPMSHPVRAWKRRLLGPIQTEQATLEEAVAMFVQSRRGRRFVRRIERHRPARQGL